MIYVNRNRSTVQITRATGEFVIVPPLSSRDPRRGDLADYTVDMSADAAEQFVTMGVLSVYKAPRRKSPRKTKRTKAPKPMDD